MGINTSEFDIRCDVHHCSSHERGALRDLNDSGWRIRTLTNGRISAEPVSMFTGYSQHCICSGCLEAGHLKDMGYIDA